MDILLVLLLSVLPVLVITAGLTDLTTMTIPNWISLALVAGFVPAAFAVGLGPGQIALHFGFGVAALFVGVALFALNLLGGGDAGRGHSPDRQVDRGAAGFEHGHGREGEKDSGAGHSHRL